MSGFIYTPRHSGETEAETQSVLNVCHLGLNPAPWGSTLARPVGKTRWRLIYFEHRINGAFFSTQFLLLHQALRKRRGGHEEKKDFFLSFSSPNLLARTIINKLPPFLRLLAAPTCWAGIMKLFPQLRMGGFPSRATYNLIRPFPSGALSTR